MTFPTPLNLSQYIYSRNVNNKMLHEVNHMDWYDRVRNDSKIKYLVLNTGMSWSPFNFIHFKVNHSILHNIIDQQPVLSIDELLELYQLYFHLDGPFLTILNDLIKNYNITILWRDTTPAGSCIIADIFEYHDVLSKMNRIAYTSLVKIGCINYTTYMG